MIPAEKLSKEINAAPKTSRRYALTCALRAKRHTLGLTLVRVAAEVKVSAGFLSELERGAPPGLTVAARLARFYGVPVEELWPHADTEG